MGIIISAFPGTGKSFIVKNKEELLGLENLKILDSDSSNFSWMPGEVNKIRNPKFPQNYIEHIKKELTEGTDVIFVSSHSAVRRALQENHLKYYLVYPINNTINKTIYKNRFIERGNSEEFINAVMNNWEVWIDDMNHDKYPVKIILSAEKYLFDYIFTIIKMDKNRKNKVNNCFHIKYEEETGRLVPSIDMDTNECDICGKKFTEEEVKSFKVYTAYVCKKLSEMLAIIPTKEYLTELSSKILAPTKNEFEKAEKKAIVMYLTIHSIII